MVLTDKEQEELLKLIGERLDQIKDAIPYIDTADEAKQFVIGSIGTLRYFAKKLLHTYAYNIIDRHINSETNVIKAMIERLRLIQ